MTPRGTPNYTRTYRTLLESTGIHINVARDAMAELTDDEGQIIFDQARVNFLLNVISHALEEAYCQIPVELIPNPRPINKF